MGVTRDFLKKCLGGTYSSSLVRFRLSPVSIYCFGNHLFTRWKIEFSFLAGLFSERAFPFHSFHWITVNGSFSKLWIDRLKEQKNEFGEKTLKREKRNSIVTETENFILSLWHDFTDQWRCMNVMRGRANFISVSLMRKKPSVFARTLLSESYPQFSQQNNNNKRAQTSTQMNCIRISPSFSKFFFTFFKFKI